MVTTTITIAALSILWVLAVCIAVYNRTQTCKLERVQPIMMEAARARAKEKHNA